jgi:hypothetical protein
MAGAGANRAGRGSSASSDRSPVTLGLSDSLSTPTEACPWAEPLVDLGGILSRYAFTLDGRQLIVTLSVPRRDFAAVLVGCGWIITRPAPMLEAPQEALRRFEPGTPVRFVTERHVIVDYLAGIIDGLEPTVQLRHSQSKWLLSKVKAVAGLTSSERPRRSVRPGLGGLGRWARLDATWDARLASPLPDLAIVGTLKWLNEDLAGCVSVAGGSSEPEGQPGRNESETIGGILLPESLEAATWFTRLYASSLLADQLPLPKEVRAAVLDGSGAIKFLAEVEAPIVICILDRSVTDETAAEIVVQRRNSGSEPLSLKDEVGWHCPAGVEALAFTVAL